MGINAMMLEDDECYMAFQAEHRLDFWIVFDSLENEENQ
jgi:hypothetical protein